MKKNVKCYICIYCQNCSKEQEQKCRKLNYALFTTEEQKQLCELICEGIEKDDIEMD